MPLASIPLTLTSFAERLGPGYRKALEIVQGLASDAGIPAYLVGGPVRDFLLGAPVSDLDISVEGDALPLASRLADVTGGEVTAHVRFGTATVDIEDTRIDLVTARRELYPVQGQLPKVAASNIADDLARRDFTINAMALPISGEGAGTVDHWNGVNDLKAEVIRTLHPNSFADDPTRMFRAVRYEQRFGFQIEDDTLSLLKSAVGSSCMNSVSGDRWRHEIERILDEVDPGPALLRASQLGLLSGLHPALATDDGLKSLSRCGDEQIDSEEWLAAMFAPLTISDAEGVIDRLRLSGRRAALARDTILVREAGCKIREESYGPSGLYRLLSGYDPVAVELNAKIAADHQVSRPLRYYLEELRPKGSGISGNELLEMGASQGPAVGRILSQLLDARLDGCVSTIDEERALARSLVSSDAESSAKQSQ